MKSSRGASRKITKKLSDEAGVAPTKYFVRKLTGVDDEEMVRIILATGADRNEIREACERYFENYYTCSTVFKSMSSRARKVYDILDYNRSKPR